MRRFVNTQLNDFAAYGIFVQQGQYRRTALAKIYGQKNCPAHEDGGAVLAGIISFDFVQDAAETRGVSSPYGSCEEKTVFLLISFFKAVKGAAARCLRVGISRKSGWKAPAKIVPPWSGAGVIKT